MEDNQQYNVPPEASVFLGFVGVCMVFMVVFYLYLTKKFCFQVIGNFPCCDDPLKVDKKNAKKDLQSSFAYDDDEEAESSTDSEEEVLKRLYRSNSSYNNLKRQPSIKQYEDAQKRESLTSNLSSIKQSTSSDRLLPKSRPGSSATTQRKREPSISSIGASYANRSGSIKKSEQDLNKRDAKPSSRGPTGDDISSDLISLAEKGRIGKEASTGGSCSSESGSADTEEEALVPFLLEKAKQKATEAKALNQQSLIKSKDKKFHSSPKSRSPAKAHYSNDGYEKCEPDGNSESSQDTSTKQEGTSQSDPGIIKCGSLQISHAFDAPTKKLTVNVIQAQDLPSKDRGGANQVHVRLILLPHKRQKCKTKGRLCGETGNPQFNETFTFSRINPEDVMNLGIRFRLYSCERIRRELLIGESSLAFACTKPFEQETKLWLTLEPRSNLVRSDSRSDVSSLARSDSTGSTQSMQNASLPELLLGLAYNGTTGRLQVSVIKGSQFRNPVMSRAPDTSVKLSLVSSSGQEIARSKTSIRRGQPNPLFKETFVFQVALFQLPDVTLMVSVYSKRSMKRREMIGWFSLGLNSSGEEENAHWNDMRDNKGEQVHRWHVLLDS